MCRRVHAHLFDRGHCPFRDRTLSRRRYSGPPVKSLVINRLAFRPPRHGVRSQRWHDRRFPGRPLRLPVARRTQNLCRRRGAHACAGVGANTAIFSIVNAVLLHPLPYPDASRLFVIYEQHPAPVLRTRLSAENFLDLQREARSFEALGGYIGTGFTLTGRGEAEFVVGQMISAELLDALDVQPL